MSVIQDQRGWHEPRVDGTICETTNLDMMPQQSNYKPGLKLAYNGRQSGSKYLRVVVGHYYYCTGQY